MGEESDCESFVIGEESDCDCESLVIGGKSLTVNHLE